MLAYIVTTVALHVGGLIAGLITITPTKPPKRWSPGQPHDVRLDGRHKVRWEPMD